MNWLRTLLCLGVATSAFADEPRDVAEAAMKAWVAHDPEALHSVSHPELISRMRSARIVQFYLEERPEKRSVPKAGSDAEVVALMCEALAAIVPPRDGRFIYEDRYVDTKVVGDLAVVTYLSSVTSAGSSTQAPASPMEIVLKKQDGRWLFLWSPAVSIHLDLNWDPRP